VSGCGDDPAREAVAAALEEPDTARFQSVVERGGFVCGEVNGRARAGGFTGYRRFVYDEADRSALIDPGRSVTAAEVQPAEGACGKPFAYQSVDERMSCANAPAAKVREDLQNRFEAEWRRACA
jgi:hypothetical protein